MDDFVFRFIKIVVNCGKIWHVHAMLYTRNAPSSEYNCM